MTWLDEQKMVYINSNLWKLWKTQIQKLSKGEKRKGEKFIDSQNRSPEVGLVLALAAFILKSQKVSRFSPPKQVTFTLAKAPPCWPIWRDMPSWVCTECRGSSSSLSSTESLHEPPWSEMDHAHTLPPSSMPQLTGQSQLYPSPGAKNRSFPPSYCTWRIMVHSIGSLQGNLSIIAGSRGRPKVR